jgi:serine/threonine protein kinase
LDKEGNVKIGDFGLSNILKPGEFLKTQCGSPNYAAPEVLSGVKYCGTEVDVWSLGVVLYAIVARELPFDDPSIPVLFARIKSGNYKMKSHFSKSLKDLVSRMLTVDPIERITIEQIKFHDWVRISPGYIKNFEINKEIVKLYKSPEVCRKAIKETLEYKEFKGLGIEEAEKIIREKEQSEEFDVDGDDLSASFNILLDLEIESRKKELDKERISKKGCLKIEAHTVSGKNTAASSFMSNPEGRTIPCNWVYGFRSTLQYCYLSIKLLEAFKKLGLFWKMRSKSSLLIKNRAIKIIASIFNFQEVIVIDFTLQQGTVMEFFEVIHSIYKKIYKFTHI